MRPTYLFVKEKWREPCEYCGGAHIYRAGVDGNLVYCMTCGMFQAACVRNMLLHYKNEMGDGGNDEP